MRKWAQWIWDNCIKNKASAWQAICAVVLTIFNILLYKVSDRATETSRASERAFLNFSHPGLGVKLIAPDKTWTGQEVSLNWVNSGNTPAKGVVIQANVQAWRSDLPLGYAFPENKANSLPVIGPKQIYGTLTQISKVDLVDAWQGQSHLFFWGSVTYKDIFPADPDRLSEFCVEMTHVTFAPSPGASQSSATPAVPAPTIPPTPDTVVGFQWQACREHNCYDEDCKDYSVKIKQMRAE